MRFILLLLIIGVSSHARAETPLRIAVASNFQPTLEALLPLWAQRSDRAVTLSTGPSGVLTQQILHGAPFDLFFAADADYPAALYREGAVLEPRTYTRGQLALACHTRQDTAAEALRQARRLGLAKARTAPYGRAAQNWLAQHGKHLTAQRLEAGSVSGALQFVVTGNVDCALVAASFERLSHDLHWHPLPQAPVLNQKATIVRPSPDASEFLQFILDQPAQRLIQSHGYLPVE